jgi:hypothetical protein
MEMLMSLVRVARNSCTKALSSLSSPSIRRMNERSTKSAFRPVSGWVRTIGCDAPVPTAFITFAQASSGR